MSYVVIEKFKDKDGKVYEQKNTYPFPANKRISKKRLIELSTEQNKYKRAFIKEIENEADKN